MYFFFRFLQVKAQTGGSMMMMPEGGNMMMMPEGADMAEVRDARIKRKKRSTLESNFAEVKNESKSNEEKKQLIKINPKLKYCS